MKHPDLWKLGNGLLSMKATHETSRTGIKDLVLGSIPGKTTNDNLDDLKVAHANRLAAAKNRILRNHITAHVHSSEFQFIQAWETNSVTRRAESIWGWKNSDKNNIKIIDRNGRKGKWSTDGGMNPPDFRHNQICTPSPEVGDDEKLWQKLSQRVSADELAHSVDDDDNVENDGNNGEGWAGTGMTYDGDIGRGRSPRSGFRGTASGRGSDVDAPSSPEGAPSSTSPGGHSPNAAAGNSSMDDEHNASEKARAIVDEIQRILNEDPPGDYVDVSGEMDTFDVLGLGVVGMHGGEGSVTDPESVFPSDMEEEVEQVEEVEEVEEEEEEEEIRPGSDEPPHEGSGGAPVDNMESDEEMFPGDEKRALVARSIPARFPIDLPGVVLTEQFVQAIAIAQRKRPRIDEPYEDPLFGDARGDARGDPKNERFIPSDDDD
jgi:hypothetical protein